MATGPLGQLWEGYVQGQELKQKKARDIADQTARKFEQQFKLTQAQEQSKLEEARLKQEQERIGIERQYATVAELKQKETERQDKAKNDLAEAGMKLKEVLANINSTTKEQNAARAEFYKARAKYEAQGYSPETAYQIAAWADSKFNQEFQPGQQSQPQQFFQPGQQSQPQSFIPKPGGSILSGTGNPLQDLIQSRGTQQAPNRLSSVTPPSETPDAANNILPLIKSKMDNEVSKIARRREMNLNDQANRQANVEVKKARALLDKANVRKADATTELTKAKTKFEPALMQAQIQHLKAQSQSAIMNAHTAEHREERLKLESVLESDPSNATSKAGQKLMAQLKSTRDETMSLSKAMSAAVTEADGIRLKLQDPAIKKNPVNRQTLEGHLRATADSIENLRYKYLEANSEYLDTLVGVTKYKLVKEGTPSGGTAPTYQQQLATVEAQAKRARDLMIAEMQKREAQFGDHPTPAPTGPLRPAPVAPPPQPRRTIRRTEERRSSSSSSSSTRTRGIAPGTYTIHGKKVKVEIEK